MPRGCGSGIDKADFPQLALRALKQWAFWAEVVKAKLQCCASASDGSHAGRIRVLHDLAVNIPFHRCTHWLLAVAASTAGAVDAARPGDFGHLYCPPTEGGFRGILRSGSGLGGSSIRDLRPGRGWFTRAVGAGREPGLQAARRRGKPKPRLRVFFGVSQHLIAVATRRFDRHPPGNDHLGLLSAARISCWHRMAVDGVLTEWMVAASDDVACRRAADSW